ncbi:uncharacterized protein LOC106870668 isoform X1 [Octopus bimaculoides]|uniref:IgGFc-binding protein N-terminal domain-containing protein n=2 Tax=Octopus bimaculoides TaxID=37653 RepID=A0A0L8HHF3_OCTBM|nr:uncharacterized protein LOC106870668 isoform X1 [Octopus bimaculoides]|eukprot:XP_014772304.1 PREDICTED: uncharacterized protein LOC106870668 isoform X1 [Octopus bimaculoides]
MTSSGENKHSILFTMSIGLCLAYHFKGSLCNQSSGTHFLIPNVFCKYTKGIHIKIWSMTSQLTEIKVFSTETSMTFMLDGNNIRSFTLPCGEYSLDENLTSGYKISSSQVISVYVEYLHDVYLVYSLSSLGYVYVIPILPNSQQPGTNYFNFTVIMSHNNNTTLTLTTPPSYDPSKSILKPFVNTSPSSHVLVLNESETVTISCQCNLSGFRLVANQPVFVIFGQYSKHQNDEHILMIESLQPVSTLTGQYFVYVPNWIQINSILYIMALQSDTKITWRTKNGEQSKTLEASQQQLSLSLSAGDFAFIHSEKGVLLLTHIHHTLNQSNAMTLHCIPPTLQYLNLKYLLLASSSVYQSFTFILYNHCNGSTEATPNLLSVPVLNNSKHFTVYNRYIAEWSITYPNQSKNSTMQKYLKSVSFYGYFGMVNQTFKRMYPFPIHSFPTINCPNLTLISILESISSSNIKRNLITDSFTWLNPSDVALLTNIQLSTLYRLDLGNGIDEDCDSRTDEELNNQKDDDGDGLFDEDLTFIKGCKLLGLFSNEGKRLQLVQSMYSKQEESNIVALVSSLGASLLAVFIFLAGCLFVENWIKPRAQRTISPSFDT